MSIGLAVNNMSDDVAKKELSDARNERQAFEQFIRQKMRNMCNRLDALVEETTFLGDNNKKSIRTGIERAFHFLVAQKDEGPMNVILLVVAQFVNYYDKETKAFDMDSFLQVHIKDLTTINSYIKALPEGVGDLADGQLLDLVLIVLGEEEYKPLVNELSSVVSPYLSMLCELCVASTT